MGKYSIKDLEKLSRIKAHTIRIWEKRYNLISPQRSDTNIRSYGDNEVKKLLNISILNNNGVKISHIAEFTETQIKDKVKDILISSGEFENHVQFLIGAMMNLDEEKFIAEFNSFTEHFGFEKTMLQIIYPLLDRIGVLWLTDQITPAHEHFISNLIRQKLLAEINKIPSPTNKDDVWILYLPEHESHELGLLFAYYFLKNNGKTVFYLGQNVPIDSLSNIMDEINCAKTFSTWTSPSESEVITAYYNLALAHGTKFYYSGQSTVELHNAIQLNSPEAFKEALK